MKAEKYRVLREHIGPDGQLFSPKGDMSVREAVPHEVAHLVPLTLELITADPETLPADPETLPADPEDAPDDAGYDTGLEPAAPETGDAAPENKAEAAPETAAEPAPARKGK